MASNDSPGILDTNIIVRLITGDPPHQAEAVENFLREATGRGIKMVVLPTVLLEAEHVLRTQYHQALEDRRRSLHAVVESPYLEVLDRPALLDAILIFGRVTVSFTDAYLCAVARRHCHGNLVSFDRKLTGVDGINRIEPESADS